MAHVKAHPKMSITTWMEVPALAGSTPARARAKGRAVPTPTEKSTMINKLDAIAQASSAEPAVMYTRIQPPAAGHNACEPGLQQQTYRCHTDTHLQGLWRAGAPQHSAA